MNVLALSRPPAAIPTPILAIDTARFEAWLQTALPGSLIEYHRGHLCVDRAPKLSASDNQTQTELNHLANHAMGAAERGLVHLVQRRHGPADFSYLAIKSRPSGSEGRPLCKVFLGNHEEPKT